MSRYQEIPAELSTAIRAQDWAAAELLVIEAVALQGCKPDIDFDGEKLFWKQENLANLKKIIVRKKTTNQTIVQVPVIRHLSTRNCERCDC
jgi:hypothetical protein